VQILIIGASWIGDMVMAQSLLMTLKTQQPNCQIDVLAPKWTFALLARMPEIREAIEMPLGHGKLGLLERIQLGKTLRPKNYDRAYLLPNSWKSAITPFFANIPLRVGYVGEYRWGLLNNARRLDKTLLTKTVQRFVALAYPPKSIHKPPCPIPKIDSSITQQQQVITKFKVSTNKKTLILCAGAEFGDAKRWPIAYFADVANYFLADDWQVWLLGSDKDQLIASELNTQTQQRCHNFAGQSTITEAIDLMALATIVISNDSGLMHLAAALNKNLIALYGSSDPNFTPPLNKKSQIIYLGLSCSPCFKRQCPFSHYDCLMQIKPERVIQAVESSF
jgi:heptosyltransferase-2